MLNWADTFRAAAVEQVKIWGSRSGIEVMPIPDKTLTPLQWCLMIAAAQSRKQNYSSRHSRAAPEQENLMDELSKFVGLWTKSP